MDFVDDRFNKFSIIITSQISVFVWYDIIGEATISDSIFDRIVNLSYRIDVKCESTRKANFKSEN